MTTFEPKPFGRYVLLEKLAVGGMAEIYKAKTFGVDGFEKLLAIKRILPHCSADKDFITMLIDEAKLTVLLSHANIVQVYDLGKVGDDYFISMEFIHGTNLRELFHRGEEHGERLPEDIAVYITSEICKGLDYAHRKTDNEGRPFHIVHRDISPQNILLSYEGEVKIVDFGIAKAARNVSNTMAGILKGKIAYMSPEQALGKSVDNRTDVFSTGVVLYEMLTGEKLFQGDSQFQILRQIRTKKVSISSLPNSIPAPLKGILAKALAYNASDRYQTAGDLQIDLTKYLYSSYIDFSPRHLSALLHKLFKKELKEKQKDSSPLLDEKTRSVIIEGATREQIVVQRDDFEAMTGLSRDTPLRETNFNATLPGLERHPSHWSRTGIVALILFALGFGGTVFYKKMQATPPPPPEEVATPAETPAAPEPQILFGSVRIVSDPPGATILVDGISSNLSSPATLEKLELGKSFRIRLEREHYEPYEEMISVSSEAPLTLETKLKALAHGIIEIRSEPEEANIILNETNLVLKTPARIENLELEKNYTLQLTRDGYEDWKTIVQIKNFDPLQLKASLLEKAKAPLAEPMSPETPPVVKETVEEPTPVQEKKRPKIQISSEPSRAIVTINGKRSGKHTPAVLSNFKTGERVTIKLVKEGYHEWTQEISLDEARPYPISVTLEKIVIDASAPITETSPVKAPALKPPPPPEPIAPPSPVLRVKPNELFGELRISTIPARASIIIDGELIAPKTPVTISKVPRTKTHTVRLELRGYRPWTETFDMADDTVKKINVSLDKE